MDSRGPKRHGNNERSVSGQQHSTGNMGGLDSAPIKQEGQAAKRANPWQNANKAPKGSEWWRKP
jgi:hypothetical protein